MDTKLFVVAGNSFKNKAWMEGVVKAMAPHFSSVSYHLYEHWNTGAPILDFKKEADMFSVLIGGEKNFFIFAKSAGVAVALEAIRSRSVSPRGCIFVGTPVYWAKENDIDIEELLKNFSFPVLFVQHTNDPAISSDDLKEFLMKDGVRRFKFVAPQGDSHDYPETEMLVDLTKSFVKETK